jgi:prophage regulatory protein
VATQDRLIRAPEMLARCGLNQSSYHRLRRSGDAPRAIKIGLRAVAFSERDVQAWIEARIARAKVAA